MAATDGACHDLSILCVTKAEERVIGLLHSLVHDAHALGAEIVIVADGHEALDRLRAWDEQRWAEDDDEHNYIRYIVHSRGYIESVLDEAIEITTRPYVLRIDDDESMSSAMLKWLESGAYRTAEHWQFPRQHMWETGRRLGALITPHLYPDFQTRLSVRSKAGGRSGVHAPSPHGGGEIAPVSLIHWKYTVRSRDDRFLIAQTYDNYSPGYGTGNMLPFSLPEEAYETMRVVEAGDGSVPWVPTWETVVDNRDHGF